MKHSLYLLAVLLLVLVASCTKYQFAVDCPEGTEGMSYSSDIQPIFDANCLGCHSGANDPALSAGSSYDALIDGGYVDTDLPCESSLYQVFSGTHDGRATEEEVLMILGWIQDGAEDN
jgi:hypothetical protein